jgi:diphthine-ammonia ligase
MAALNVVALISGGKDSFFSILHCQANGHTVVALANLHPPHGPQDQHVQDMDSFMYQTIGHGVIPLYEQALGLPLYRQEILGSATVQDKNYAPLDAGDETESLLPLLRRVLAAHPEVNAISTGAILSDYQRTRVESVALRLGMTPLSYLWRWPVLPPHTQTSLLHDMAAVGQDSRIIKVASGGLDESFLWQNVADPRVIARLSRAADMFGTAGDGAVLGEGGEFETLAVDGPAPLWKGSIEVSADNLCSMSGDAGSASVEISRPVCVMKEAVSAPHPFAAPRIPSLLDSRFDEIQKSMLSMPHYGTDADIREFSLPMISDRPIQSSHTISVSNITGEGTSPVEQTRSIMHEIVARLACSKLCPDDISCTIIVLRDMADFAVVNPVYGTYFSRPNPPARVTVACADVLPAGAELSITVICSQGKREGLHVQSRSYWAPANIGPYSQAIKISSDNERGSEDVSIYIAGQIPLVPASMQLPTLPPSHPHTGFTQQSVLALQHLERIGAVMGVQRWACAIAFIASSSIDQETINQRADILRHIWKQYHQAPPAEVSLEEEEEIDVWDMQNRFGKPAWQAHLESSPSKPLQDPVHQSVPRLTIITADSLPRNSDVEWVGHGLGRGSSPVEQVIPSHFLNLLQTFEHRIVPLPTV